MLLWPNIREGATADRKIVIRPECIGFVFRHIVEFNCHNDAFKRSFTGGYNFIMMKNTAEKKEYFSANVYHIDGQFRASGTRTLPKKLGNAWSGIYLTFKTELSFRVHIVALFLVVIAGYFLHISVTEWCLVAFAGGFVLTAELFNTAVERLGDEASGGDWKKTVKNLKDISAGAVLVSVMTAVVISIIVLLLPLVDTLFV